MVIDAHLHCTGQETTDEVLRALDEARIDHGVLLAPFLSPGYSLADPASLERANTHLARLVRGQGDRLSGLAVVNPSHPGAARALARAFCRQSYFQALGMGVSPGLLSCDTNGVDTRVFKAQPGRPAGLREQLGLARGCGDGAEVPLIGFVGRLSPEKGPEVAVRAALLLQARCPDAHLVLVGDGPMRGELAVQIRMLGLGEHVHLLGLRDDMPAVYNDFDLVVCPSHSGMAQRARQHACERFSLDASVHRVAALLHRLARPHGQTAQHATGLPPNVSGIGSANGRSGRNGSNGSSTRNEASSRRTFPPRNGAARGVPRRTLSSGGRSPRSVHPRPAGRVFEPKH